VKTPSGEEDEDDGIIAEKPRPTETNLKLSVYISFTPE
jgi:hypothetical protein